MLYNRTDGDWEDLVRVGKGFLEERARLEKDTSYTELDAVLAQRTGLRPFDFDREDERAAMGHLLGLVVEDTYGSIGCMLSALVLYLNGNTPGSGFFRLAVNMSLLATGATEDEKLAFWSQQMKAVFRAYGRPGGQ